MVLMQGDVWAWLLMIVGDILIDEADEAVDLDHRSLAPLPSVLAKLPQLYNTKESFLDDSRKSLPLQCADIEENIPSDEKTSIQQTGSSTCLIKHCLYLRTAMLPIFSIHIEMS
jgi:hypothetical protein